MYEIKLDLNIIVCTLDKHYIFFHDKKHPIEMGKREIEEFLTHLAIDKKVSPFIIKILLNLNYRVITLSTYTPAVQSPLL